VNLTANPPYWKVFRGRRHERKNYFEELDGDSTHPRFRNLRLVERSEGMLSRSKESTMPFYTIHQTQDLWGRANYPKPEKGE
jgi:hypothetical protein